MLGFKTVLTVDTQGVEQEVKSVHGTKTAQIVSTNAGKGDNANGTEGEEEGKEVKKVTVITGVAKKKYDPTEKGELMETNIDAMEVR